MKFDVYAPVTGGRYIGQFEAEDAEEAIAKAMAESDVDVDLCHQCATQIEEPEIDWDHATAEPTRDARQ